MVHVDDSTVTVAVTTDSVGAGGMVTVPETTALSVAEAEGAADAEAADCNCWPIARAEFLKLVNELGAPSAPQLTAKTIPAPQ